MKDHVNPRSLFVVAAAILLSACGSDAASVNSGAPEPDAVPVTTPDDSGSDPDGVDSVDGDGRPDGDLLASSNMGGTVFDGRVHKIDSIAIAESYPEQLQISFTGSAEPCVAADATATAVGAEIVVQLVVGLPENAAAISCVQGEFEHRMSLPLSEGIDGRNIVLSKAEPAADLEDPPDQPFESTLIGMSEESAQEGAESFGYTWRVAHRDGEDFIVTTDYSEDRINATIIDGVVTDARIG